MPSITVARDATRPVGDGPPGRPQVRPFLSSAHASTDAYHHDRARGTLPPAGEGPGTRHLIGGAGVRASGRTLQHFVIVLGALAAARSHCQPHVERYNPTTQEAAPWARSLLVFQ